MKHVFIFLFLLAISVGLTSHTQAQRYTLTNPGGGKSPIITLENTSTTTRQRDRQAASCMDVHYTLPSPTLCAGAGPIFNSVIAYQSIDFRFNDATVFELSDGSGDFTHAITLATSTTFIDLVYALKYTNLPTTLPSGTNYKLRFRSIAHDCISNEVGPFTIVGALTAYNVTGGAYCQNSSGAAVGLSNSQTGVTYQLLRNNQPVGSAVTGTGSGLSFGNQNVAGTYTVQATNLTGSCQQTMTMTMTGSVSESGTPLPLPTVYNVTGGGAYCTGGTGVVVGLASSQTGVNYQLLRDGTAIGSPLAGTGSALSFGNQTAVGTYTVQATNATTGCQQAMSGSVSVTVNPRPVVSVINPAPVCSPATVNLNTAVSSDIPASFAFFYNVELTIPLTNPGAVSSSDIYYVRATSQAGCQNDGLISVGAQINPLPVVSITGLGSAYCQDATAVLLSGSPARGSFTVDGTAATQFDPATLLAGNRSVVYTYTDRNGCTKTATQTVTVNALPTAGLTSNGPFSCSTSSVTLTASGGGTYRFSSGASQIGNGPTATVSTAGVYSVTVTSANGCSATASVAVTGDAASTIGAVIYVKKGASGNGASWECALGDLQAAINGATPAQQIWVAAGEYQPAPGQYFAMKEGVKIYGGFANSGSPAFTDRNWSLNTTVLKGNGSHVIRNDQNGLTNAAVLDGFTLTGGAAEDGGGMLNYGASPLVNHCIFRANQASRWGGGIYNLGAGTSTIANSLFYQNSAQSGGAAFSNLGATPSFINVTIVDNTASQNGGAVHSYQGAESQLVNAIVWGNQQASGSSQLYTVGSGQTKAYFSILEGGAAAIIGNKTVAEIASADPLFVNAASRDYGLQACSPAINMGTGSVISGELTTDLAAGNRTYGGIVDLGAYEFQAPIQTGAERLATNGDVTTVTVESGQTYAVQVSADACRSVAVLESTGSSPLSGPVTITTRVDSQVQTFTCSPYVQRHYDIAPASGGQTASVTLYFTQAEFDAFNQAVPTSGKLPSGPQDVTGLANLRVYQYGGSASGGNGPGAYSGPLVTIDPVDTDIHWDYGLQRWSVRVGVSGGGGFFVGSASSPLPAQGVSLTASGSISCTNPTVILTASPGTGVTYQFSSGATQVGNGPTAIVSNGGVYSVTVVSGNGCSVIASTTVAGDQSVPQAGLQNDGPLSCTRTSVTLTASGGGTGETLSYRFSSGATQIGSGPTATVSSAGVYSVTVVSGNGCSSVASTTVVGDVSVPPIIISQSQSATTICAGDPVNFNFVFSYGSGGGRADLYRDNTFLSTLESSTMNVTSSGSRGFSINESGSYQIVVTGSCTSVTTTYASITVNPLPTAGLTNNGPISCSATSVTLTASGAIPIASAAEPVRLATVPPLR